ncbi:ATP-binding protein [Marinisporobacter balticus]|uniref:DNA replication protein DnaC n=1 Tax=Marinisporobacter balticus TaxID=2018667 RepID=A0A4R2L5N8_9FIRM|nr:ATP-binding protein [Marinisporobacter balticus]TCO77948.1 DNA replication protein DnaC [Marinisporobacter balticus]
MHKKYIKEILLEYEKSRDFEKKQLDKRKSEVYEVIPKIKEIDTEIGKTGILISKAILGNTSNYEDAVSNIHKKMERLKQEKAILLTENNVPIHYLHLNYQCSNCKDTGFVNSGKKCNCFKQKIINRTYAMSNLNKILKKENFHNFNIELFSDQPFEDEHLTPRQNMLHILNVSEGFVINFNARPTENLLFYGTTGLGKTFLCNCIAKSLLDKGKIVVYQTAFKILEILEDYKFNKKRTSDTEEVYHLLFDSDLLIIDDLGTELTNTFTNTEFFNIINTRLIQNKKIIISTNLSPDELANTYSDRIFSRIVGSFTKHRFYGKDLRWES